MKMITAYLVLVFGVSWTGVMLLPPGQSDYIMFVPALLAIILTICGKEKLGTLFKLPSISNLLMGLLLPLGAFALYLTIASATSIQTFGMPETAIEYNNGDILKAWTTYLIFGMPYLLFFSILFAFGEEIGWRGYLLRKFKPVLPSFWVRALTVGAIWGIWHLPFFLQSEISYISIFIFLINVCLISICYTVIYEYNNSAWPTVLAHGLHNTLFNAVLPVFTLTSTGSDLLRGEEGLIVTACYGLIILAGCMCTKFLGRCAAR